MGELRLFRDEESVFARYTFLTVDLGKHFGPELGEIRRHTSAELLSLLDRGAYKREHRLFLHVWRVPYGVTALDPRLFEIFRKHQPLGRRIPLVIYCLAPTEEDQFIWRHDPFDCLDDLAWTVERMWEVEWDGVKPKDRPGLVLARPDGTVVLNTGIPPRLRPALMALSVRQGIRADFLGDANFHYGADSGYPAELSRVLALLRSQGVLNDAPPELSKELFERPGNSRRPLPVYDNIAYQAERLRWHEHQDRMRMPPWWMMRCRLVVSNRDKFTLNCPFNAERWLMLVERLRARGLRSV